MGRDGRAMLDRVATVHRPDCAALAQVDTQSVLDDPLGRDSGVAAEARATLRRPYDALRRLVGQVAGLLVLAQASGERAVLDLASVRIAHEQWREVSAVLADISVAGQLRHQLDSMTGAARLIGACLASLEPGGASTGAPELTVSLGRISGAYKLLQTASDMRLGLDMVDFRQSCCNCSHTT